MQTITLHDYKIFVGDFRSPLRTLLQARQYTIIGVLVDENTRRDCLPAVAEVLADFPHFIIEIPSGEINKNLQTCTHIWSEMMHGDTDRNSLLINLGGGVIGDTGGFCASTFKRGIDFLQIPTTLLAQADASIGGKLGIDFNHIKNSIGVFNNPQAVLIDTDFLQTLSLREVRSGFAEIIKHALIADAAHWPKLLKIQDLSAVNWGVYLPTSLKIKQHITEADPFEKGIRKALNFGHTIGHALESRSLQTKNPLLHGEAVALGMICEAYLSVRRCGLSESEFTEIKTFIERIYQPQRPAREDFPALLTLMRKDKKNAGTEINFTFLSNIGTCEINGIATEEEIYAALYGW